MRVSKKYAWLPALIIMAAACGEGEALTDPDDGKSSIDDVSINPPAATVMVGDSVGFKAHVSYTGRPDTTVTWTSSDPAVALVNPVTGMALGRAAGFTFVIATSKADSRRAHAAQLQVKDKPVVAVTVKPDTVRLRFNQQQQFTATATNITSPSFTWSSSDESVVVVTSSGLAVALQKEGTAKVKSCVTGTTSCGEAVAIVSSGATGQPSVTVSPSPVTVQVGATSQASATCRDASNAIVSGCPITWTSSATGVATVSSSGVVTGVAAGQATLTARWNGTSGTAMVNVTAGGQPSIAVTPNPATVAVGGTTQLTATFRDAQGNIQSKTFAWTSSATGVATVSSSGVVTGVAVGTATMTAAADGISATTTVNVSGSAGSSNWVTISADSMEFFVSDEIFNVIGGTKPDVYGVRGSAFGWSQNNPLIPMQRDTLAGKLGWSLKTSHSSLADVLRNWEGRCIRFSPVSPAGQWYPIQDAIRNFGLPAGEPGRWIHDPPNEDPLFGFTVGKNAAGQFIFRPINRGSNAATCS